MELREVEYHPWSGTTKKWYFDDGNIVCVSSVDLDPLVEQCKAEANEVKGFTSKRKYHKVASLPPLIQHEILKKYHLDCFSSDPVDQKRLERIIEIDYPYLKTNQSKLWRPSGSK